MSEISLFPNTITSNSNKNKIRAVVFGVFYVGGGGWGEGGFKKQKRFFLTVHFPSQI